MMNRAYATFEIKRADREERIIEGIASTPTTDLAGDIVEPRGMKAGRSVPFLWQHSHDKPLGHILDVRATDAGVFFKAKLAKVDEAGTLRDRLEEAWQSIRSGLVRGISIGFSGDDWEPIKTGGRRFKSWILHEISAVTIPANSDCTIQVVKRYADTQPHRVVKLDRPPRGVEHRVVKLETRSRTAPTTANPVAGAIGDACLAFDADLQRMKEIRELGPTNALLVRSTVAGATATDAALAELRERLNKLENR